MSTQRHGLEGEVERIDENVNGLYAQLSQLKERVDELETENEMLRSQLAETSTKAERALGTAQAIDDGSRADGGPTKIQRAEWLSRDEVDALLDVVDDPLRRVAVRLGAECGLRSDEIVSVEPGHVVDTEAGKMLTVPEGKGDKYRETPIPDGLADLVDAAAGFGDVDDDEVLVDRSTRQLRRWIKSARRSLADETGDDRWLYLTFHDLRRTWAGQLANADVDETIALRWGGWADLETFLNHHRGDATPAAQRRERGKVYWL